MSSHVWSLDDLGDNGADLPSPTGSLAASITADGVLSMGDLGRHLSRSLLPTAPYRCAT